MFAAAMMMKGAAGSGASDPDALAWIAAVEAADGEALEGGVAVAVDAFVTGLKEDGLWARIDQCAILAGARTLAGALVPLRGAAVVNNGFGAGDYDRKTGLRGDGSSKYLLASAPAYGRNDAHLSVYLGEAFTPSGTGAFMGNGTTNTGSSQLHYTETLRLPRVNYTGGSSLPGADFGAGLFGASRFVGGTIDEYYNGTPGGWSNTSAAPVMSAFNVFARGPGGSPTGHTSARLAWFSHGRAITLNDLAERLDMLMDAFAAGIP